MSQNYSHSTSQSFIANQLQCSPPLVAKKEEDFSINYGPEQYATYQKQRPATQYQNYDFTITPKPLKKIVLYGENKKRYMFNLANDKEVGIRTQYQDIVIESWNDDDKKTSTTQMQRGIRQTLDDFYDVMNEQKNSQYSQSQEKSNSQSQSPSTEI